MHHAHVGLPIKGSTAKGRVRHEPRLQILDTKEFDSLRPCTYLLAKSIIPPSLTEKRRVEATNISVRLGGWEPTVDSFTAKTPS